MKIFSAIIRLMKKLVRLFFLCMLMLAIPVQGLAAATMLYCGGARHHAFVSGDVTQHSSHSHDDQHEHHHDATEKKSAHFSTSDASITKLPKDKCSSCSACCISASLVTAVFDQRIISPSSEKIDSVFPSHLAYISDGLERPPRA